MKKITHIDKYKFQDSFVLTWELSLASLKVLYFITGKFNINDQYVFPHNQKKIAAATHLSVSSVKRAISQLIEEGWIRVESQKAKRNMYFVEWDRISATKNQDDEYVFNEEKGSPMSPIWAQSGQEKGSPMSPYARTRK
jgi:hypothetical protein